MKKSWKLIPKIISGEKTIESRWYQTRRTPWNIAKKGDTIFFKNAGESVTTKARVSEVLQFEIGTFADAKQIVKKFGKEICLVNSDPTSWKKIPKYCVLLRLTKPVALKQSFQINKKGFGSAAAWIATDTIEQIKI